MNFFAVVNELSVLVVTFFMLCLSTLWYSSYLFGGLWEKEVKTFSSSLKTNPQLLILVTFFGYFIVLLSVAFLNALTQKLSLPMLLMPMGLWACISAALLPFHVWEKKSIKLYLVYVGFLSVLINLGSYLLYAWNG